MKIVRNIWMAFAFILLFSCSSEPDDDTGDPGDPVTRGVMSIEIMQNEGNTDKIETARFLVFKNALGSPELELNERFTVPAVSPGEDEVSKFKITLEVTGKLSGSNDLVVVAIVNEPSAMKNELDQLRDYEALANLELSFADFLNDDHTKLQDGKTMPMTGVVWTNKIYATEQDALAYPARIDLLRAVAKVDVYVRKQAGLTFDLGIGTNIILGNTYDKEYFVRNKDGGNIFGKIQNITSGFLTRSWAISTPVAIPDISSENNGLFVCSFYTPERICTAPGNMDKLTLSIHALSSQNELRSRAVTLDELSLNSIPTPINSIDRNNIYRVIVSIMEFEINFTAKVLDWTDENIQVEF